MHVSRESEEGSWGQATGVPVALLQDRAGREDNALNAIEIVGYATAGEPA